MNLKYLPFKKTLLFYVQSSKIRILADTHLFNDD